MMVLPEELQFMVNGRKTQKRTEARMDGKTCVVTGATSGIGLAVARRLAQGGADLVLVCRNPEKASLVKQELEEDHAANVGVVIADFSDLSQVRLAAEKIIADYTHIDVLVNNAGIHNTGRELNSDGFEMVFCVNHLASFLLTRLLTDRIKESAPSRILYVNSSGHRFGGLDLDDLDWGKRRYWDLGAYGASKTAQLFSVWELADRLRDSGVTVNAMHPGAVVTNIGMNNGLLYRLYQRYLLAPFMSRPVISGEAVYYLVASPEMDGVSGLYFNQTVEETPAKHAMDRELGAKVWAVSEKMTGLEGTQ